MDCLVECEQLGSAGSLWCNMFSGGQQTQARERVLKRTLHSNTRDTLEGGYTFFYSGSGPKSTLLATKPKRVGPGVVSLLQLGSGAGSLLSQHTHRKDCVVVGDRTNHHFTVR